MRKKSERQGNGERLFEGGEEASEAKIKGNLFK
jgi:hypothetical protein